MRVPQPKVSKKEIREAANRAAVRIYDGTGRGSAFREFTREVFLPGVEFESWTEEEAAVDRIEGSYHDVIALEVSQALVRLLKKKVTARTVRLAKKREANRRYRIKRGLPVTEVAA